MRHWEAPPTGTALRLASGASGGKSLPPPRPRGGGRSMSEIVRSITSIPVFRELPLPHVRQPGSDHTDHVDLRPAKSLGGSRLRVEERSPSISGFLLPMRGPLWQDPDKGKFWCEEYWQAVLRAEADTAPKVPWYVVPIKAIGVTALGVILENRRFIPAHALSRFEHRDTRIHRWAGRRMRRDGVGWERWCVCGGGA